MIRPPMRRLLRTAPLAAADVVAGGQRPRASARRRASRKPPIQARPGGPEGAPKTDQTVDVVKGTRLVLTNNAGEVVVRSWDRDQVHIVASHSTREQIDAQTTDMTLRIRSRSQRGPSGLVDYQLTVPKWMAVNLSGTYLEATIEGTAAEVTVETVHGNAKVVGGGGAVSLRSVEGIITVDKASGRVQATTVNEGIRITNVTGEITAETTNGDIVIENAQTLEPRSVDGQRRRHLQRDDSRQRVVSPDDARRRHSHRPGRREERDGLRAHVPGRLLGRLPHSAARRAIEPQRQQALQLHDGQRQRAHRSAVVQRRHRRCRAAP